MKNRMSERCAYTWILWCKSSKRVWKVILDDLPNPKQKFEEIKEHEG